MSEEDRLPLSADADTLSDRQTSGPSSTTVDEADQSIDNSRALTLYSLNSLTALDASLSEEDESQYIISQNTISRSMIAINYLLNRWTIGTRSDARNYFDDDRPHYRNRTGLPKPWKENLSSKPSTRFTTSQPMNDSNRSGQPFQSHKKVPESSGTVEQKNRRQNKHPDIMQSIPFMLMRDSCHLNPIMSYKTANPDLIWETTYDAHLEAFTSKNDNFCWAISDDTGRMSFLGKVLSVHLSKARAGSPWESKNVSAASVVLPAHTPTGGTYLRHGIRPPKPRFQPVAFDWKKNTQGVDPCSRTIGLCESATSQSLLVC